MTTINQELYEALKEAGASEDAAKRAAANVYDKEQLATNPDLAEMRMAIEAPSELGVRHRRDQVDHHRRGRSLRPALNRGVDPVTQRLSGRPGRSKKHLPAQTTFELATSAALVWQLHRGLQPEVVVTNVGVRLGDL